MLLTGIFTRNLENTLKIFGDFWSQRWGVIKTTNVIKANVEINFENPLKIFEDY